ncbi:MAG TPA: HEAT repeat domain-containing protein [Gemmataceae bacterium]|nr:HEAT repeat domain-containing protein [Gemmataceae bacterium]
MATLYSRAGGLRSNQGENLAQSKTADVAANKSNNGPTEPSGAQPGDTSKSANRASPASIDKAKDTPASPKDKTTPADALVKRIPKEVQAAVIRGLNADTSLTFETLIEGFNPQITYHAWKANMQVKNNTGLPVRLVGDYFLIEADKDGKAYEGVAILESSASVSTTSSYGLINNYQVGGTMWFWTPGHISMRFAGSGNRDASAKSSGQTWMMEWKFEQQTWLRDDLRSRVLVVYPEVCASTGSGTAKFRIVASFAPPGPGSRCKMLGHEVTAIDPEALAAVIRSGTAKPLNRILAANWLADNYAKEAVAPLVEIGKTLNHGQLCVTCLNLLRDLKGKGLEAHALDLFQDANRDSGIRSLAAMYLGSVKHEPALDLLIDAAQKPTHPVVSGASAGLALFGQTRATKVLLELLNDVNHSSRHAEIASQITRGKDPEALKGLEELASTGNLSALDALANAGLPETFPFFVDQVGKQRDQRQRDTIARGLCASGGDKALFELLKMLESEPTSAQLNAHDTTEVVRQLAKLNSPKATPRLVELAHDGNLRALQVLASSRNDSVREPLTTLAGNSKGAALRIALVGLQSHWAKESSKVFAKNLGHSDKEIVHSALTGLQASRDPRAAGRIVQLVKHQDMNIRSSASFALRELPLDGCETKVAEAILDAADDNVVSNLAEALIKAKWKDKAFTKKIGNRLALANAKRGQSGQRGLVRLLRQLSGDAMGPRDDNEYYRDPDGWSRRWVEWAMKQ